VIFVSHQTDAIDNALYTFIDAINEYVKVKNISPEEINELKELIFNTYKERKAEVFMSSKINSLLELINNSFTNTIKNSIEGNTKRSVNDFVYYNNRKRSITHEQY
jgi:flagellar capping protein FliD